MKRFRGTALLAVILIACTACASSPGENAVPELLSPVHVADDTAVVTRRAIINVERFDGKVIPYEEELLFGEGKLRISTVECIPGDTVSAGDILVRLDVREALEDMEDLERELAALETGYALLNESYALDMEMVQVREENIVREYEALVTDRDLGRHQKQMEELANEMELLRLRNEQAVREQVLVLEGRRAKIDRLRGDLESSVITASFDGVVVRSEAKAGEMARPFEPAIVLADYSRASVALTGSDSYHHNPSATLTGVVEGKNRPLIYTPLPIDEILAYVLEGYRQPYFFEFGGAEPLPEPGQYVCVLQSTGDEEDVLTIPINAVYSSAGQHYVYRAEEKDGGAVKAMVTIQAGRRNESYIEVLEGLAEGDVVFVRS